jgi:hypothetical protein
LKPGLVVLVAISFFFLIKYDLSHFWSAEHDSMAGVINRRIFFRKAHLIEFVTHLASEFN